MFYAINRSTKNIDTDVRHGIIHNTDTDIPYNIVFRCNLKVEKI